MKIANTRIADYISNKKECEGSNIFAEYKRIGQQMLPDHHPEKSKKIYVVYSYGYHFPMYCFIDGIWVGNSSSYSPTTARHKSQANPGNVRLYIPTKTLKKLVDGDIDLEDIIKW